MKIYSKWVALFILIQFVGIFFIRANNHQDQIEDIILREMKKGNLPGVAVAVIKDNKIYYKKGFGYADIANKIPVTDETLFEIGSNSKAFTGLAILKLEREGKLRLDDPVSKYLPNIRLKYNGSYTEITLKDLLYQTSGIPFQTICSIPISQDTDALERTVNGIVDYELDFQPGDQFLYATINYDVLGLIIQKVTKQDFESYIRENILNRLELYDTYLFRDNLQPAKGYKPFFLTLKEYNAPVYRGNTPAGYYISNLNDMCKWVDVHLNADDNALFSTILQRSYIPNRRIAPNEDGSSYAVGWYVYQSDDGELRHGGNNPNYSSFIGFRPGDGVGVVVLSNINSAHVYSIGNDLLNHVMGKESGFQTSDMMKNVDKISFVMGVILLPLLFIILFFIGKMIVELIRKQRTIQFSLISFSLKFVLTVLFLSVFIFALHKIPDILFWGVTWDFVKVWAPQSLIIALQLLMAVFSSFAIFYLMSSVLKKKNDRFLFLIIVLSIMSGLGNALIIFVINASLNRPDPVNSGLILFFILGLLIYIIGQKIVRTKLITITNSIVYEKRIELMNKILRTNYHKLENIETGKILAGLNNDTEAISEFAGYLITGATSLITLICCFIYLGTINLFALAISIIVIFLGATLYFFAGRSANILWEETRDIQNAFFKFINDLIYGFKELYLNTGKKRDFKNDMQNSCKSYKEKRIMGDIKYANVFVIGELLFTFVIGTVVFLFPYVFKNIESNSLKAYVFVFLYMTGPVNGILSSVPVIFKAKVNWKRLKKLLCALERNIDKRPEVKTPVIKEDDSISLELNNIEYSYKTDNQKSFNIGPIDVGFKSGEITFITGGNGSGKSTLAKIVTGLYEPDGGKILINRENVSSPDLSQYFSTVFSDYYLFEKLYGIDYDNKVTELNDYLNIFNIKDKVNVVDGKFDTIKLSTGQKKRLALIISYLEDRPIYLFDEWAADQDPKFRHFFYNTLLPELKKRGKCVIAITHDDRYFNLADKIIKMEFGQLVTH